MIVVAAAADVLVERTAEDVAAAATETAAGTVTAGPSLHDALPISPGGAGPFSVTLFAVAATPPTTDVGDKIGDAANGLTVRVAALVTLPKVAEMVATTGAAIDDVEMVN